MLKMFNFVFIATLCKAMKEKQNTMKIKVSPTIQKAQNTHLCLELELKLRDYSSGVSVGVMIG